MSRILIAFASTHGHTAKIADRIAEVLRADGHAVDVCGDVAGSPPDLGGYDAAIVGASVHAGRHQSEIRDWAAHHATQLNTLPTAFFSVCLTAADDTEESHTATRGYLDAFEAQTGWTPGRRTTFAGALQYREYDFMTRLFMRILMHHQHHPTDTSRDYEYTDWDAVAAFARECAQLRKADGAVVENGLVT